MKLIRYNYPNNHINDFDAFFADPFRAFEPLFRSALTSANRGQGSGVEWFEDQENYFVRVDVPGVKREDLHLDAEEGVLRLSWDVEVGHGENEVRKEKVERVFRSPEGVRNADISAKLEDGVLTLTLPKAESARPKQIKVGPAASQPS